MLLPTYTQKLLPLSAGTSAEENRSYHLFFDPFVAAVKPPRVEVIPAGRLDGSAWVNKTPGLATGLLKLTDGFQINTRRADTAIIDSIAGKNDHRLFTNSHPRERAEFNRSCQSAANQ